MQQDNLINPQSVNEVIQTFFGGYEKFVLNLIERRKELESEKLQLTKRLKEIEKEEGLIKSVLTGTKRNKSQASDKADKDISSDNIKAQLSLLQKEDDLIKKVLGGFHGKKIDGQYFNAENYSLDSKKPSALTLEKQIPSYQAIGNLLALKREEYNKEAGKEIISNEKLFSTPVFKPENSIEANPQTHYRNQVLSLLKQEFLADNNDIQNIDKKKLSQALNTGVSPRDFVDNFAREIKLEKIQNKQGMRI